MEIISYFGIGSGPDENLRHIGFLSPRGKWKSFINRFIKPAISLGYKRFWLHNVGGVRSGYEMEADQLVQCREQGFNWVIDDFVEQWAPITKDYEVICYMGGLKSGSSPMLDQLISSNKVGDYLKRVADSYSIPLNAGMSIAIDNSINMLPDNPVAFQVTKLLESLAKTNKSAGKKIYLEPWLAREDTPFYDTSFIVSSTALEHVHDGWAASVDSLSGERVQLLNQPPPPYRDQPDGWVRWMEWLPNWLRQCELQGMTALFPTYEFVDRGIGPDQIFDHEIIHGE